MRKWGKHTRLGEKVKPGEAARSFHWNPAGRVVLCCAMKHDADDAVGSLRDWLRAAESVVIGYSGGVDSAFLAAVAASVLGERALAVTSDSDSLPRRHLDRARDIAGQFGIRHRVITTGEMSNPDYTANRPDRCYHCKDELFSRLSEIASKEGFDAVLDGTNVDDQGDYRPGRRAAKERGVRSPLAELGFTKAMIREASRAMGLPTADLPASACLASRIPYGQSVTPDILQRIDRAEASLEELGFTQIRVRAHGDVARIELAPADIPRLLDEHLRADAAARVRACGFRFVTLDLLGYRMGSLNEGMGSGDRGDNVPS